MALDPKTGQELVHSTMPQPGTNAWQNYNYTPEQSKLRGQMAADLAASQATLQSTQKSLGLAPQMASIPQFQERGIKLGNKVVATNELNTLMKLQKNAIQDYVKAAGFTDTLQAGTAEQILTDKFNKIRLDLISRGQAFDRKLTEMKMSRAEKMAFAQNMGAVGGAIVGGIIGGGAGVGAGAQAGSSIGGGFGAMEAGSDPNY